MLKQFWTTFYTLAMPVRLAILFLTLVGIFIVDWILVLGPQGEELDTLSSRMSEIQILQEKKTKLQAAIVTQKAQIQEIERELAGALEKLPNQKEIPQLLDKASSLGRDAGLDITLFRQKPEAFGEFYVEVPVEMSARTDYHQLRRYFFSLGMMPRIVNIRNIALKVDRAGVSLQASFLLTTYRFLAEAEKIAIKKAEAKTK
jgi:type IV pilus assembly protein PilO